MNLHGKVAIVTGAASGIGAEIARLYLEAGAQVVGVDRNTQAVPQELHAKHPAALRAVSGDVSVEQTAIEYTRVALSEFGRIDIMVNNAGIAPVKPIHMHTPAEWDAVMNINVKSIYFSARHVVPVMQAQGGGLFLNTGSISSVTGMPLQGAYGPSKGAVIQVTRQMAIEYARDNIRSNAVCPGTVDTPLLQQAAAESGDAAAFMKRLGDAHPIGRIAQAEEIAQFFLFLASDNARFITGAILMIDGGYTAQ